MASCISGFPPITPQRKGGWRASLPRILLVFGASKTTSSHPCNRAPNKSSDSRGSLRNEVTAVYFDEPAFWRAGSISTIVVMSAVLIMLTIDSLAAITPGGSNVPPYTVINQHIDYKFVAERGIDVPVVGEAEPLFGRPLDSAAAAALIERGKMVIQSRACIDCHTFFGNGAYYAPDLTK